MADTHILGAAEPVDGPMQMGQVVPDRLAATVEQITNVERPSPDHLYWPSLDVDLAVASIRDPEAYPLVSRG